MTEEMDVFSALYSRIHKHKHHGYHKLIIQRKELRLSKLVPILKVKNIEYTNKKTITPYPSIP
jgi:hypothetical protein